MITRIEFMAELKEWSDTAQKQFDTNAKALTTTADCVYAGTTLRRLQQHRDTKLVADTIHCLLARGEPYDTVARMCREKAVSAFRAGDKALGETWWDWSHNYIFSLPEKKDE
jgi:hypothetical protein